MKKRIKRIAPVQLGKMLAVIYALFSLILVPLILLASLAAPEGTGPNLLLCVVLPIGYVLVGFIGGILGAFIYNASAHWVGGVEIEFEE